MLLKHAMYGGAGDKMALRQLAEALSALTVPQDGVAIESEWFSSDVAAFEFGAAHSGSYPLDDQVALEFGNGPDDDDDGAA